MDKELLAIPAIIAGFIALILAGLIFAVYEMREQTLRCYAAQAQRSAAEMVLLCK